MLVRKLTEDDLEAVRGGERVAIVVDVIEHREVGQEDGFLPDDQHVVCPGGVFTAGRRHRNNQGNRDGKGDSPART